jgi:L-fuconolactonase
MIDHMGLVSRVGDKHGSDSRAKDDAALATQPDLLALAKFSNVGVKVSCLPAYTAERYPFPTLQGAVRRVYDAFGPSRMFWGSDFSRLKIPYAQNMTLFTEEMQWLSADDKALIMGRAICNWLDWSLPA